MTWTVWWASQVSQPPGMSAPSRAAAHWVIAVRRSPGMRRRLDMGVLLVGDGDEAECAGVRAELLGVGAVAQPAKVRTPLSPIGEPGVTADERDDGGAA